MAKQPPMTPEVYEAVMDRSQGRCEVGIPGVCTRSYPTEWHHRQLRSGGGKHEVVNGCAACIHCHSWVHQNPRAARAAGWIVSKYVADPGVVPMRRHGRDVLLTEDGWFEQVAA